jgi:hypothetical protein
MTVLELIDVLDIAVLHIEELLGNDTSEALDYVKDILERAKSEHESV